MTCPTRNVWQAQPTTPSVSRTDHRRRAHPLRWHADRQGIALTCQVNGFSRSYSLQRTIACAANSWPWIFLHYVFLVELQLTLETDCGRVTGNPEVTPR